jgi:DNA-binding transcriptional ArsR family regulator
MQSAEYARTTGYPPVVHESSTDFVMPADEQVQRAADAFRLLADPTRIKILWALLQGESSVAGLAEVVVAAPTAVSQHLSKLRLAGLVHGRRQGTFVYYTADDDRVRRLLHEALFHVAENAASDAGPVAVGRAQA